MSSHLGIEPRTFGLEVQRAIHCANGTQDTNWLLKMVLFQNAEKVSARIEYHSRSVSPQNHFQQLFSLKRAFTAKVLFARAGARTLDR